MADDDPWLLKEDGFLNVGTGCRQIVYHPNLNVLLVTTASAQVYVFDVNCGVILQRCTVSGKAEGKLHGVYLGEGVDKILYTDGRGIGVRGDYNGVLLLDTILQMPVFRSIDTIKLEMLLSEAILLHHCLRSVELSGVDHVQEVLQELSTCIAFAKTNRKKGIKAQKWNTICLQLPHGALKLVCSNLVMDLKKHNKHIPALPIASAISERLNGLLPGLVMESGTADKVLMFSEAARRDTFSKWPHMNYKWALPDQMAQAGFYHQPNSTGEDRAMCFTCSVCLVCWEPTDEPWSEHERHSPACPFVKGEYTQNVPLSVTLATAPAQAVSESVDVIGTTNVAGVVATASSNGFINVWNVNNQLKREVTFYVSPCDGEVNNKDSFQFVASKTPTPSSSSFLPSLVTETDALADAYKPTPNSHSSNKLQLTALALVDGPKFRNENKSGNSTTSPSQDSIGSGAATSIRPCLVCGVSVSSNFSGNASSSGSSAQQQLRTLENVWATSTDLASSSSLVRAMNSVNSAASSTSLDIMKVATDHTYNPTRSHYLILCDFHHKTTQQQPPKKDSSKDSTKSKKQLSGTGTSASSNGIRQESLYQEILLSKFLLEEINEDVDPEMVGSTHFDSIYSAPHTVLTTANGIFYGGMPVNSSIPTSSSFDANSNPISPYVPEQFASTSKMTQLRKTLDTIKTTKAEPVVIQTLRIEAEDSLRINNVVATKDGKHLFVTLCPQVNVGTTDCFSNTNQMDVDDETLPKSFTYWDHNDVQSKPLINGETQSEIETNTNSILLVYALDFSDKVVRLTTEPILRRELPPDQAPTECVLLPSLEKARLSSGLSSSMHFATENSNVEESRGQVALVCRDGVVRLLDLNNLKTITEAKLDGRKFISAAYCTRLERLCACTSDGALHFFSMTTEDDSTEEKDGDDLQMITDTSISDESELTAPSTSTSSPINQEHILAHRQNLTHSDLRMLYDLTRFDRHSPAYAATVPPCWSEMMQAQRQRRYPQHLHQSEDQHHTRTWRLQNDTSTWDEHIFELTLPRKVAGNVGHVDVRFSLHFPCLELPIIQVTLLKQNMTGIGSKSLLIPVDEKIDFRIGREQKADNPVITDEYLRHHNTEILCGPVNLQRCMDLSDHSGCVTLTSPKLFRTKAKTLLVHIKALIDPTKEGVLSKSRSSLLESKPPTSKKLRIDEAGPLPPGATVERFAANATKKLDCFNGCDWIHEISITVRSVHPTNISNEKLQRCAMLESKTFIDNLLSVACLQTSDKSPVVQSLALDILIWVAAIRLTRLRTGLNSTKTKVLQLETVRCVQERLPSLLRTCLLHAGRSIAHKCVKLIVLCSEGLHNLEDPAPHAFEEAVLSVLVTLLPYIVSVQWAGSLRWLAVLVTRLLPLDRNHSVAQQCISLIQEISTEMSKRVNPYHLLLATRFGLYNSPFETELFDMDPPVFPKSSSVPVTNTYSSIATGEPSSTSVTSTNSSYTQDAIDLRDLLSLPSHSSGDLIVPSKLKALCANHSMKGLLEVEPLHFTCHAASDGTKMEKIDPSVTIVPIGSALYDSAAPTTNVASQIIHHAYNFEAESLGPDLQAKLTTKITDLLSQCTKNVQKANYEALSKKAQDFYTPDDQSDSDEASNMQCGTTHIWNVYSDKPPTLTSVPKEKSSSVTNIGTSTNKVEDAGAKKRDDISFPWGRLLCWPPQQALVVERMHSGARRFVILDFGAPVLLTDLMIPACIDLVSLSIDIWTKSEETDGIRLVVAGDIGSKPLVVSDLQPPPVCRYLKITTIGRYGMSTTRCKIPLGMFYGHMVVLPGEDYSELTSSEINVHDISDPVLQSTIESQCTILSALAEDVQCRFTLATERLKSYLDPLLCTETPNVIHMQHYLTHSKNSSDSKEQPSAKILSTYQECIMYQHQLNIIRGVWQRLESWQSSESTPPTTLVSASSDKLRILGETLLDILLYTVYEIGPVPTVPTALYETFTPTVCEKLFNSICVMTPAPHLQLYAVALLARMAGHQPWWGNFLANTLINLYSVSSTHIFPQDRVFILLTFLGRKSLIAAANKSSVVDAMVRTLGRLLAPISTGQTDNSSRLDTTLIGWVLLFLSVCLDTTAIHPTSLEENHDKNKEQGFSSRWEFIQGELAMQRKFVSSSRSSASRSYRKKLQKRLMHHKQQLQDLEQAKKSFHNAQVHSVLSTQAATFSTKLEAALKSQERVYKKTLKQHSAKHFKDLHVFGIRRNDLQHLNRSTRSQPQPSTSQVEPPDPDGDYSTNLSHHYVLPVARGLVALLLNNASNVDMFLLACKVVARLVVSTRPAISLGELMTEDQLLKLVRLATGTSDTAWSSHAVSCLLQDLLEGEKLYPRHSTINEPSVSEETFEPLPPEEPRAADDDSAAVAGTSNSSNTFGNDEGFADGDEDTQDSIIVAPTNASTSKTGGFNLPSLLESDDSEFEEFLDNILERGKTILKKGSAASKYPTITSSGISQAIDARLEYGVETGVEIALRRLSALGTYNLPLGINATINPSADSTRHSQPSTSRQSSYSDRNQDTWTTSDPPPSSLFMLTRCFDKICTDFYIQSMGTNLELVLQLWLTLNLDATSESNSSHFDPSLTPVIPLSSTAIAGLISAFSWHPGVSLRAWCYVLQCLTLASNQPLQAEQVEAASCSTPLDGLLGGMAGCIIKERNMGAMLLRLLSGNGLNVDTANKHFGMAGPTLCQALQDFLLRLEMRCDVITPGSALGNSLKELLLWVVYQLVQPGGALVARRGPLDAQCKLITSLLNLNFTNTDLGTAMSISECVGELVSTYVRGAGVGAQCGGTTDSTSQSGGFGGLYACVLGGDARQGRPASWDALVVALIKLVCRLVQTPLPSVRTGRSDSATEMELGESSQSSSSSQIDRQEKMNTSQTDESKVAEQQTSSRSHQTSKPRVPCVADTVLQHEPTMMRLLGALGHSSGSSLAMLLGEGSGANATTELTAPPSIPDATFQLLCTLTKKASNPTLVLNPVYQYLASSCRQGLSDRHMDVMQLSEPLLWFILRVLDNEASLSVFTSMGGVKVLCENLVKSSKNCNGNGSNSPGVIALVMQHLSNATNLTPVVSSSSSSKKSANTLESFEDGLLNFAPLGTVSWLHPTAQPADVLIQSVTPHKRARSAAWSYHFYPDEAWVDLTITLPCAILLKEVELQPHLTSLSTCPSAVALEISREGNTALTPICPPMPTAGLTFIRLTLSQPEVATAVLVRLYKPRDSTNISLSQIRLLGTTAFGDPKSNHDIIDEEQLTKTSLGWLRLVHQCLSVSTINSNLTVEVLNSAASVEGLVESCCNLLLLPAPSLFTPNLERVLLQLGLHSSELGLRLINLLLNNRTAPLLQGSVLSQETTTIQMVVELLEQLCSAQDSNTKARMSAVLNWLYTVAESPVSGNFDNNSLGASNSATPPAVYIHCISTIIWKAAKLEDLNYDLKELLTDDLFDALYQWTLTLKTHSALKQAIDSVLCAFCCVKPTFFQSLLQKVQIIVPNLSRDQSDASISDDRKESEGQTDDGKSITDLNDWYARLAQSEFKRLSLTEGQLLSIAAAARSPPGVCQLINSSLPMLLSACIMEFAILEKSRQAHDYQRQQQQHIERKLPTDEAGTSTGLDTGAGNSSGLTDSDKAGENVTQEDRIEGLDMTEPESVAIVLEFLSLVCSEGKMRDWLGKEGSSFWLPLLTLLSDRPIENPSASSLRCSKISISYAKLESAMIKFLSKCCWCHPANQKLLAELLTEVIVQQKAPASTRGLHGISGFTRRLILQLLLEGEKILVSVTSEAPMKLSTIGNSNLPVMPPHPAFPLGHYHHLLYMSTQSTVADILQQVSGTWLLLLLPNNYKGNEAGTSSLARNRELWESGMNIVMDTLSVAAGNTAKDKRAKEASNRSQARGPLIRKTRLNADGSILTTKSSNNNSQGSTNSIANQNYLILSSRPNTPLPPELTIAQLLSIVEESGVSLSEPCLYLTLRQRNKDSKEESSKSYNRNLLTLWTSIDSTLEVFSSKGGLAVLAKHLPLVYPDSSRPVPLVEKSPTQEQSDADWVKIEHNDNVYEDLEEGTNSGPPRAIPPTPQVPPHSLAAFGLFLRLPGYSEVLLKDRKRAQCLLRLALGVTDDGEGGDVLSSPLAASLPTLPFQVLKQLLDDTPPTTDDGLLLRRTSIEVGAVLLLLNCLAIFTHQTGHNEGSEQRSGQSGGRSDDKSHLYWAKGTGFGTGSTQQSWNVELALIRQRSEEEHVTVLLQVLASYIGTGDQPQKELPTAFTELLSRSCLLPSLSSYLRNDSVLDMARHIPLYRAVLQLLRAMANSSQLAPLLLPRSGRSSDPSIVALLSSMRLCVDTYVHKINKTKNSKSKSTCKYPEDSEQDEGLATLIPDIQDSATIVQNATARLVEASEEIAGPSPAGPEIPLRSIEQRYLEVMKNLQFDTFEMIVENPDCAGFKFAVSYHFESNMRAAGERNHPTRVKRLAQEAVTLSTALPLSYSSSVFVRCDTDRLDVMKVLITGPAETPYANGCFEFDVYFPSDYPNNPMMINLETTGRRSVRFNPNLYNDGKVCLSVLNTWHGRPEEKWNAHTSSFLQVLVSIQSLILVSEPYFNEPGYERSRGTSSGAQSSQEYNANVCQATAKWAMLDQIRNPCPCFKEVIHTHFWLKRHEIVAQIEGWIRDMEMQGADRRSTRTISLSALALRRHYKLLREELNKLPTPEGLEDLAEPLRSPSSPLEMTGTPGTPSTPPTSTLAATFTSPMPASNNAAETSNHVHHDIDTDVEMEKMVSKVCE